MTAPARIMVVADGVVIAQMVAQARIRDVEAERLYTAGGPIWATGPSRLPTPAGCLKPGFAIADALRENARRIAAVLMLGAPH
jgi:hypothetical protein